MLYILAFIVALLLGAASKLIPPSWAKNYTVEWSDSVGVLRSDIAYASERANKFDLYLPADRSRASYGLIVYLHAGGFTSGDKADDRALLEWFCSKGYVAAGINYTLRNEANPTASVYSQSMEIKAAVPVVLREAEKLGYPIDALAIGGGSAGHCLAMIYAYRDAAASPVPVKMVFGAVGPSSFYPEDWTNYGFDQDTKEAKEGAANLFGVMSGNEITPELLGTPAYDEAVKDISPLLWVDETSAPSLLCYGAHDRVQPFAASARLAAALAKYRVPHDYIVCEHSGHGLQNDNKQLRLYQQKMEEYLNRYLPVR